MSGKEDVDRNSKLPDIEFITYRLRLYYCQGLNSGRRLKCWRTVFKVLTRYPSILNEADRLKGLSPFQFQMKVNIYTIKPQRKVY